MSAAPPGKAEAGAAKPGISVPGSRGLRRDAPILLPASLLLFATLASVTLLSYRSAVASFAAEREQAALRQAVALAEAARLQKGDDLAGLARGLPAAGALAIYDARGGVRMSFGFTGPDALARPMPRAGEVTVPRVEGLGERTDNAPSGAESIAVLVPFDRAGQRLLLRFEMREPTLFAQQRSLRILTPVVFGLSLAVALLAIFFLRALVRPYEALLERARAAAPAAAGGEGAARGERASRDNPDDVEFLLATFDRALAALRAEAGRAEAGHGEGGRSDPDAARNDLSADDLSAVERTLGPQLESGLLMFDRAGQLLAANPAAVELLAGAPVQRASGAAAAAPTREAARAALAAHPGLDGLVAEAIAAGRSIPRASVAIERAGRRVELGLTLQALRRNAVEDAGAPRAGTEPGFLVLFADVTDLTRREAEERFAAGLAQLGELSAGVAHELRNSLATVQGYLTMAARRELPAEAREELGEAQREARALAGIVDDFLTFARPGSGALEPVDLAALLQRATSDPALAGVDCELALPASPLPAVVGDPYLLQRALRNLLLNAAQATLALAKEVPSVSPSPPGRPAVVVRLQSVGTDSAAARITIDDSGAGLAPGLAGRLFEPFVSGRPGGAGLGLALARRIIVMHGGTLTLEPRAPRGMRAEIRIPLGKFDT